ncbi:hypothetical protein [Glycomyces tritici]|uniref:Uncharacterized protein n=1 Tax=Glycomyces tritici TaxID=2665176 RepID=A0ABT7YWK9_9ACTN|nr:hypothetical protein [Glycomyces tritici]MDN3243028.1 hypothetical protein [Glycomyces tritici]
MTQPSPPAGGQPALANAKAPPAGTLSRSTKIRRSIIGGGLAVFLALFGFVADIVGIIDFAAGKPAPELTTTAAAPTAGPDPEPSPTPAPAPSTDPATTIVATTEAPTTAVPIAEPSWTVLHEGLREHLGGFGWGDGICSTDQLDFDRLNIDGFLNKDFPEDGSVSPGMDLIWDDCTGYDYAAYIVAAAQTRMVVYPETVTDPAACFDAGTYVETGRQWAVDPWAPENLPLETGATFCVITDEDQVALATITDMGPAEDEYAGLWVVLDVTVWTWA